MPKTISEFFRNLREKMPNDVPELIREFRDMFFMQEHLGKTAEEVDEFVSIDDIFEPSLFAKYPYSRTTSVGDGYTKDTTTSLESKVIYMGDEIDWRRRMNMINGELRYNDFAAAMCKTQPNVLIRNGIILDVCGHMRDTWQSPWFDRCIRDERQVKIRMHSVHFMDNKTVFGTSSGTVDYFMSRVPFSEDNKNHCAIRLVTCAHNLTDERKHLPDSDFIQIRLEGESFSISTSELVMDERGLPPPDMPRKDMFGVRVTLRIVHMQYTYFNHLHALSFIDQFIASKEGMASWGPMPLEEALKVLEKRCNEHDEREMGRASNPDGAD